MTLMTVFLFFLISSIGLGMAYLARVYQKLGAHKIRAFRMSCLNPTTMNRRFRRK